MYIDSYADRVVMVVGFTTICAISAYLLKVVLNTINLNHLIQTFLLGGVPGTMSSSSSSSCKAVSMALVFRGCKYKDLFHTTQVLIFPLVFK